jgi:hypothetical protein
LIDFDLRAIALGHRAYLAATSVAIGTSSPRRPRSRSASPAVDEALAHRVAGASEEITRHCGGLSLLHHDDACMYSVLRAKIREERLSWPDVSRRCPARETASEAAAPQEDDYRKRK